MAANTGEVGGVEGPAQILSVRGFMTIALCLLEGTGGWWRR